MISLNHLISQYVTIYQQLQTELATLREKLQTYEARAQAVQQCSRQAPKLSIPQCLASHFSLGTPASPIPQNSIQSMKLQEESLGIDAQGQGIVEENSSQ